MKNKLSLLFVFCCLILTNCADNFDEIEYPSNCVDCDITRTFNAIQPDFQVFQIDAQTTEVVELTKARIEFPKNIFIDKEGHEITGAIKIELLELFKNVDLIKFNKPTVSETGETFKNRGAFYIKASQGNETLFVKDNKNYTVSFESDEPELDFQLYFFENESTSTSLWEADNSDQVEFSELSMKFELNLSKNGWFILGEEVNYDQTNPVCVTVPSEYNLNNMQIFAVYKDENIIQHMSFSNSSGQNACSNPIPLFLDKAVNFIALTNRGEDYYEISKVSLTTRPTILVQMEPIQVQLPELKLVIESL